jgi:hypothetical protein
VPPAGDALQHHASGFAKIICSAVFVTGLDPDFAAENVGYFTAPYEVRHKLGKPIIDRAEKAVHVTLPNGVTRTANYLGSQGCVTLPVGQASVNFTPANVASRLPDPFTQPWPMGDVLSDEPLPPAIDATKLKQAIDATISRRSRRTSGTRQRENLSGRLGTPTPPGGYLCFETRPVDMSISGGVTWALFRRKSPASDGA